jgi:DNA-binding GntR family transcriptional regulator
MVIASLPLRDPRKPDRVHDVLRPRNRDLELSAGAAFRTEASAVEFGLSRAPIGSEIARLAEEGLGEGVPRRGRLADVRGPQ